VTRIIAGQARGRRLKVPTSLTRPTSDRVRESLFASLETVIDLDGAHVLDLYAGSGALGLEARSRGAAEVILVDRAPAVARVIAENIAGVGLSGVRCDRADVRGFLRGPARPQDVVFLDPPYDMPTGEVEEVLRMLGDGWLASGAVVVVERGEPGLQWPDGFTDEWGRSFGGTHVLRAVWYRPD
jgi:16S rRNA (guanine966-N2)-methyltransferase